MSTHSFLETTLLKMATLSEEQVVVALKALNAYLSALPDPETGLTPVESSKDLDAKRLALINDPLSSMLASFLTEALSLTDFKTQIDRINKRNELVVPENSFSPNSHAGRSFKSASGICRDRRVSYAVSCKF